MVAKGRRRRLKPVRLWREVPILLAIALQMSPAASTDFHARVTQSKLAESASTGPAYQKQMWERIGNPTTDAYKACLAGVQDADKGPFTLVADVGADGRLARIAVQPETAVARCMASHFTSLMLPAPPATPAPYPVEVDFSIKHWCADARAMHRMELRRADIDTLASLRCPCGLE